MAEMKGYGLTGAVQNGNTVSQHDVGAGSSRPDGPLFMGGGFRGILYPAQHYAADGLDGGSTPPSSAGWQVLWE